MPEGDTNQKGSSSSSNAALGIYKSAIYLSQIDFAKFLHQLLGPNELVAFSASCRAGRFISSEHLKKYAAQQLLLAVVSGDEEKAKKIIRARPALISVAASPAKDVFGRAIPPFIPCGIGRRAKLFIPYLTGKFEEPLTALQAAARMGDTFMVKALLSEAKEQRNGFDLSEITTQLSEVFPLGLPDLDQKQSKAATSFVDNPEYGIRSVYSAIMKAPQDELNFELSHPGCIDLMPGRDEPHELNKALNNFRQKYDAIVRVNEVFNLYFLIYTFNFFAKHIDELQAHEYRLCIFWNQVIGWIQRLTPAWVLQAFAGGFANLFVQDPILKRSFQYQDPILARGFGAQSQPNVIYTRRGCGLGYIYALFWDSGIMEPYTIFASPRVREDIPRFVEFLKIFQQKQNKTFASHISWPESPSIYPRLPVL